MLEKRVLQEPSWEVQFFSNKYLFKYLTKIILTESVDNITPTIGFSKFTTKLEGVTVNIYELGGGAKIRDIWNNYFVEVTFVCAKVYSKTNQECVFRPMALCLCLIQVIQCV